MLSLKTKLCATQIHAKIILVPEMIRDVDMVSVKSAGVMALVMKENGFIIFVMAMVFLKQKINESIEVSG